VIRRVLALTVLLLTVLLLQVSFLPLLLQVGFAFDLVVLVVILIAFDDGTRLALWMAAAGGILVDLLSVTVPLGTSVIVYAVIAYLVLLLRPYVSEGAELVRILLAATLSAFAVLLSGGLLTLLSTQDAPGPALLLSGGLLVGIANLALAPALRPLIVRTLAIGPQQRSELVG
jgi:rod shape-determining protein MreD